MANWYFKTLASIRITLCKCCIYWWARKVVWATVIVALPCSPAQSRLIGISTEGLACGTCVPAQARSVPWTSGLVPAQPRSAVGSSDCMPAQTRSVPWSSVRLPAQTRSEAWTSDCVPAPIRSSEWSWGCLTAQMRSAAWSSGRAAAQTSPVERSSCLPSGNRHLHSL